MPIPCSTNFIEVNRLSNTAGCESKLLLEYAATRGEDGATAARYLKTDELSFGKAVAVDDLNLFYQGALPTFRRS